jgi:type IV pilus assembly protein PilB
MRILDKGRSMIGLDQLGFPRETYLPLLEDGARPVRHGDLRRPDRRRQDDHPLRDAAGDQLDRQERHHVEDPVEYVFPGINQIQTNEQAGLTFATG